ncbi:MAG: threonylcarbamoyl-AMP synthase [Candidatus Pacebacteria bacterium]|nr:threonylcarbamoyl-AMP synthase [Candidatus Paceibacterota bacterium]
MKKVDWKKLSDINLKDKVFLLPTDTIYGFSALINDKKAVEKIKEIKKRNNKKGFIILISDISDLEKFNIKLDNQKKEFLKKIWTESVSVVLEVKNQKFKYISGDFDTLVFRIPKKRSLKSFIKKVGPIVSTSANVSGDKCIYKPEELNKKMKEKIDFYINEGELKNPSSLIINFLR